MYMYSNCEMIDQKIRCANIIDKIATSLETLLLSLYQLRAIRDVSRKKYWIVFLRRFFIKGLTFILTFFKRRNVISHNLLLKVW
jgi:hypothetical protein